AVASWRWNSRPKAMTGSGRKLRWPESRMSKTADAVTHYRDQFRLFSGETGSQPWLVELRKRAMDHFAEIGFPSTRDEDWRFTSVEPIAQGAFAMPGPAGKDTAPSDVAGFDGDGSGPG